MTRLARAVDGTPLFGDEDGFVPLTATAVTADTLMDTLPTAAAGLPAVDTATASRTPATHLQFANPLDDIGKLWGIGLNYADHAADLDEDHPDEPASFMKPASAATGPGGPVRLPPRTQTDHVTAEAELGVVIGRTCRNISIDDADDVIAGYIPIIDMTAEDILQRNPRYLTRAKSFDSFIVFGPWIQTTDTVSTLDDIEVRTVVNDTVEARNTIDCMMMPPKELVAFHSDIMTLHAGDVISTGTPGAHPIESGDTVQAEVDHIGTVAADVVQGGE